MKTVLLTCLAALTTAAPVLGPTTTPIAILEENRQSDGNGNYQYSFRADNGIQVDNSGAIESDGHLSMKGSYGYTAPNGEWIEVFYTADENGFQAKSDAIPIPAPAPAHAHAQALQARHKSINTHNFQG